MIDIMNDGEKGEREDYFTFELILSYLFCPNCFFFLFFFC